MRPRTLPLSIALIFLASAGAPNVMAQTATAPPANPPPPSSPAAGAPSSLPSAAPSAPPSAASPGAPPAGAAPAPPSATPAPGAYPYPPPGTYYYPYPQPGYYYPQPGYQPSYPAAGYPPSSAPPQYAQPTYVPVATVKRPPQHIHDGLYLRMNVGLDINTSVSGRVMGLDTEYGGYGLGFSLGGGFAIVRNLIVFATLTLDSTIDTTEKLDGYQVYSTVDLNLYGFGGGLAYYFETLNMYAAAAVMGLKADVSPTDGSSGAQSLSKLGPGFALLVGKEWWVSENWGVGGAFQVLQAWMQSADDPSQTMRGACYSLLFSATYN